MHNLAQALVKTQLQVWFYARFSAFDRRERVVKLPMRKYRGIYTSEHLLCPLSHPSEGENCTHQNRTF